MSKMTRTMFGILVASTILSVLIMAGCLNANKSPRLDVVFPLAAIFYGMFLICRMLQKEITEFDAEEHKHHEPATRDRHSQSDEGLHGQEHHEPMRA